MGSLITDSLSGETRTRGSGDNLLENVLVDNHEEAAEVFKKLGNLEQQTIKECLGLTMEEIIEGDLIETQLLSISDENKQKLEENIKYLLTFDGMRLRCLINGTEQSSLGRQKSSVPTSTNNTESTVIDKSIESLWPLFRALSFDALAPELVESATYLEGVPGQVGAHVQINYANGSKWTLEVTELSDKHHSISYQVVSAEPALEATSLESDIKLHRVTTKDTTFVQWSTDFSNDADAEMVQDQKFKKQDFFEQVKKHI